MIDGGYRLDEPPMVYWKTEVDGVEVQLWPECTATLSTVFDVRGDAWRPTTQEINASLPQPGGGLSSAFGTCDVHVNNTTGSDAVLSLRATQHWTSGELTSGSWADAHQGEDLAMSSGSFVGAGAGYAGGNLSFRDVTAAPGERVLNFGGGGIRGGETAPDACRLPDGYTGTLTVNGVTVDLETMEKEVELG